MWIGSIENFSECPILTEKMKRLVVDFIKDSDIQNLPNGRYVLDGENFVNVFEYETKENDGIFEMHKRYIDIHCTLKGVEKILWAQKYAEEIKPYQTDGDYSLGKVTVPQEIQSSGELCVFLPNEPHKAGVILNRAVSVKKAVFKLLFEELSETP